MSVTSDGVIITATDGDDELDNVRFWRDGVCVRSLQTNVHGTLHAVAALPGGRFVCGHNDELAHVREVSTGAIIHPGTVHPDLFVWCVAAMPDGEHFLIGGQLANDVLLYNVDGTLIHAFTGHGDVVNSVAVTPDGQHIISGSDDHDIKVWDAASKKLVCTCTPGNGVKTVAVMPDGQRFLSGSYDGTVSVWRLDKPSRHHLALSASGTLENTFSLHDAVGAVGLALVALPDNQHALSASIGIKLFNVNDGAVLRTFATGEVVSMALLPDGLRFVTGHYTGSVCIFETGLAPHWP
jgi:WD40 repeat protein